jgi:hypothetical protein
MDNFINEKNSSSEITKVSEWFTYTEQRYIPAFSIDFPEKPIVISKFQVFEQDGKHYECDASFFALEKLDLLAKYEVYYLPAPEIFVPLTDKDLIALTESFIEGKVGKHVINQIKLSSIDISDEKSYYLNFIVTTVKDSQPILFAGKAISLKEKYLYFLLVEPKNLLSKPDFERFIDSFKIVRE